MNILLVTHYYSTHAGGIEIVADGIARRLTTSFQISWAASDCDPLPVVPEQVQLLPMRSTNSVERVSGLPFPLWSPQALWRLWHATGPVDVVHIHDLAYFGNWAAFVFAKFRRRPVLVTQHVGLIPYRSALLRFAQRVMHHTVGRWILGRADQVVFISPVVMEYFRRFVRFRREPTLIWNGVDTDVFHESTPSDRSKAREQLGLDSNGPVFLFVGRFVEKKGLGILRQVAREMPNACWLFAGWGPLDPSSWNLPNVRVYTDRRGRTLVPLYHAADLLVLPSVGEGLPLVVQEAMSCGTPVLVGTETAAAIDAPHGIVFSCPVDGRKTGGVWVNELRRILSARSSTPAKSLSAIAEFSRSRWSWDKTVRDYKLLFRALAPTTGD